VSVEPPPNATARFLGPPEGWAAVRLALRDVHGLWGGQEVDVDGAGNGAARLVDRSGAAKTFDLRVPPAQVAALLRQLIEVDFLALTFGPRPGVPDEARPEIRLTNPAGETRVVAKWANDASPAFAGIYQTLLGFLRQAGDQRGA
jgi:hypothetical protein